MSTPAMHEGAQRQPATITVVQTLLVLSAVGSAVGVIVSVYLASVVLEFAERFAALSSLGGGVQQPSPGIGSSPQLTVSAVLAVVDAVAVVAVSIWAFGAVARARPVARVVLAVLAAAQVVLSVTSTLVAGAGVGLVVVTALVGLLVFDAPVLVLLFVPAESRRWFDGTSPSDPASYASAPQGPTAYGSGPSAAPAPSWGPPTPAGPPRSGAFPAAPRSGPFPQPPPRRAGPDEPGGRHAAPQPPRY